MKAVFFACLLATFHQALGELQLLTLLSCPSMTSHSFARGFWFAIAGAPHHSVCAAKHVKSERSCLLEARKFNNCLPDEARALG